MAVSTRDDLFALDPADFVAARDALAKELRAAGATADAAAVKKLRRPAVPVWALNEVARTESSKIDAFLDAAVAARRAQSEVLGGADASVLRDAMSDRRRALESVTASARRVIEESGRSGSTYERELDTMLAALAASDTHDDELRRGALTDVSTADADEDVFAQLAASMPAARERASDKRAKPKQDSSRLRAARERLSLDRADATEAASVLKDAQAALTSAQRAVDAAERDLRRAESAVRRSEEAVERLER